MSQSPCPSYSRSFIEVAERFADVHGACERVVAQALATHGGSPIKTFAEVDRLGGHKNAAVGRAWDHARASKKMRTTASSGGGSW